MMYKEVIQDFARRTRKNLEAIDRLHAEGRQVYEVTQLVNSILGLLVFPQQEYVDQIPHIALDELRRDGWPIPKVTGRFEQVRDLNQLIRYLRNAITHFNIKFIGDGQNEIEVLRVWNENDRGRKTWEAVLSVSDLRGIAERFIEFLLDEDETDDA